MKTILCPKRIALLLVILLLDHVFRAKSASLESPLGDIYFGRSRMLRKLPKPPPAPKLSQGPHYKFFDPPPPSPTPPPSLPILATYPSFRTVRKFSPPPAPKLSKPRNFRIFFSPPPSPPPPLSASPLTPPAPVKKPPTNCDLPRPPPGHT